MVILSINTFFVVSAILTLVYPWVGAVSTYTIGILSPQTIWWWHFSGLRPYYYTAIPLSIGFIILLLRKQIDWRFINTGVAKASFLLFLTFIISYLMGPYIDVRNEFRFFEPEEVMVRMFKNFVPFFLSMVLLDNVKKLKIFLSVIVVTVIYLTYWANMQYLTGQQFGRIHGPIGIYSDENVFAVVFVVGYSFLFYLSKLINRKSLRYSVLIIIPFCWHAVFLTGSRGGFLGLLAVTLFIFIDEKNKLIKIASIVLLLFFFIWQGGDVMKQRADSISIHQVDHSSQERLEAWKAAIKMAGSHPVTGVGIASMGQAYPYFSNYPYVRVAHNTFLQLTAENGMFAGVSYLFIVCYLIFYLWRVRYRLNNDRVDELKGNEFLYVLTRACCAALIGFFVCSCFLSLQEYEIFYYLVVLSNFIIVYSNAYLPYKSNCSNL